MCCVICDENGIQICNFTPHVECIEVFCSTDGKEITSRIQIWLGFEDNYSSATFAVTMDEIDHIQWFNKEERCLFNPEIADAKIKRFLKYAVREALKDAPRKKIYQINQLGVSKIKGNAVFCTGQDIIRSSGGIEFEFTIDSVLQKQVLDIDPELTERQAASEMFNLLSLSADSGRVILAQKLLYLMREAYVDAGVKPNVCVYLYGETGTNKTTLSSFLVQMYNRRQGVMSPIRLNASVAASVKILSETVDDVVVLDDLCPAESSQIRRKQEETLTEITRYIADGIGPARMRGKKLSKETPKCGVLFTGEYLIGKGSDAARLLPVKMKRPNGEKLKWFQDRPLIVSTFYYFYIKWFIERYDDITKLIREWLKYYRKSNLGVHARLQETHFFLNTAYVVLLQYCYEKDFLSKQTAIRLYFSFCELLTLLVQQQDRRVKGENFSEAENKNYFEGIRTLYENGQMSIASNVEEFNIKLHDGLLYKNKLYLRGNKMLSYFPNSTLEDIADSLEAQGALEIGKKSRTKQISGLNGMRFYVILLNNFYQVDLK